MREIGTTTNPELAKRFVDFIASKKLQAEVRIGDSGDFEIWVFFESDVAHSLDLWKQFELKPNDPVYIKSAKEGARIRQLEEEIKKKEFEKKRRLKKKINSEVYTLRATLALIVLSGLFYLMENQLNIRLWELLSFSKFPGNSFPEILEGQIWRLFTPALLHASFWHLFFNMMWVYQLGQMIEREKGSIYFLILALSIGSLANIAQYLTSGAKFLGMSGVVYGLFGFVWVRTRLEVNHNYFLSSFTVGFLLVYYFLCVLGLLGHIANTNHGVGLASGMVCGFFSTDYLKYLKKVKRIGVQEIMISLLPFVLATIGIVSDVLRQH